MGVRGINMFEECKICGEILGYGTGIIVFLDEDQIEAEYYCQQCFDKRESK